jgi:hypothetical protein
LKTHTDPILNLERPHCPEGRFLHVPPNAPDGSWDGSRMSAPWWRDASLVAGCLSKRTQVMRIKNVLTNQEHRLEVRTPRSAMQQACVKHRCIRLVYDTSTQRA